MLRLKQDGKESTDEDFIDIEEKPKFTFYY